MIVGGVDISAINLDNSDFVLPEVVQGRWLNADADIYAYNCAGNDDTTHEEVVAPLLIAQCVGVLRPRDVRFSSVAEITFVPRAAPRAFDQ